MRVLIACESLTQTALMRDACRIGDALAANGHDVVYAMADPISFCEYASFSALPVLPVPLLREPPELVLKRREPSGFDDVLAVSGFANPIQLNALCRSWREQLELVRPDAIVGLHAPVLWLVGPSFAPTFAAGYGAELPPVIGHGFPRMSAMAPPLAADHLMVAHANAMLRELGAQPLTELVEIFQRCQSLHYGLPWLDPYLQLRQGPSLGVLAQPLPVAPIATKKRYAAVLDVFCPNVEALMLGIAGATDFKCDVFLAGATAGMTRFLQQQPTVKVAPNFAALMSHLRDTAGFIHHGEADLAEAALAAGVPQLVLPFQQHQRTLVSNFEWMGCTMISGASDSISNNAGMLQSFARHHSLTVHAQHHARQLHAAGTTYALPKLVQQIETGRAPQLVNSAAG